MKQILTAVFVLLVLTAGLYAQGRSTDYNKGEVFVGWAGSVQQEDFVDASSLENGIEVAAVFNFHRYMGVKVDVSGTFKTLAGNYLPPAPAPPVPLGRYRADHSLYNATAGIQFKNNRLDAKIRPFAHVLAGFGKHRDSFTTSCPAGAVCPPFDFDYNGFAFILGGGLDFKVSRHIDIRAIQVDLNTITHKDPNNNTVIFYTDRLSSGIVFKF